MSSICYTFHFANGGTWSHSIDPNQGTRNPGPGADAPDWSRLDCHRCPSCPLTGTRTHCPAALSVAPILQRFAAERSTERIHVVVTQAERITSSEVDLQMALKGLLGLVMACSDCPVLARLRSQARFHQPFASIEETLYRTVGDYLIKQYFIQREGGTPDFALRGLDALYQELGQLNEHFYERIRHACTQDANWNALVVLRSLSELVNMSLEDRLEPLREAMQGASHP